MGLFGAFVGFVFLWIVRNARQHPGSIVTAFASVVGACAVVVIVACLSRCRGDCMPPSSAAAQWTSPVPTRVGTQWANLKPKLWASPIFGHGRGMSGDTISYYYPGALSPTVDSYTLTLLADVGIPGTLFLLRDSLS